MDAKFWNSRYEDNNFPWDIGGLSPAIQIYLDNIEDRSTRILIPGAGHAHEAKYLFNQGFTDVIVCDWAETALNEFITQCPDFPQNNLLCMDFFEIVDKFDIVIEQTFFCALNPNLRSRYVAKMSELLTQNGILAGLLFGVEFPIEGPPFGGSIDEYKNLFSTNFDIVKMNITNLSIEPRMGNELFVELRKKAV